MSNSTKEPDIDKLGKGFALDIPPGYEARGQEPEAAAALDELAAAVRLKAA